jgi:hypothetical protein
MNRPARAFALIGRLDDVRVRHYVGLPDALAGGDDAVDLPSPAIVLMEPDADNGVTLLRLAANGAFAGDTWHETEEDARHQAEYEFGAALGTWTEIPDDVEDAEAFAVSRVNAAGT